MDLAALIKQYYLDNLADLTPDKQFHFASRTAAWFGDSQAFKILENLRASICDDIDQAIQDLLNASPNSSKRNAHELRQPVFEKYPLLYGLHVALFRERHLKFIYALDEMDVLYKHVPQDKIEKLISDLVADDHAMRILATFGVNTVYLYGLILTNNRIVEPQHFIDISSGYNLSDKQHVQLMIYLFTHCIIGETNFYIDKIDEQHLPTYKKMLEILEPIIESNYDDIHLDNKLEFLVCCRICDYPSPLFDKVYAECQKSLSPQGHFLVDTHNSNAQAERATFVKSEHRNVLFLMSQAPYSPHKTLLLK